MRLSVNLGISLFTLLFVFSLCEADPIVDAIRAKAEQGDVIAQITLGSMYYDGNGVPQNSAEAMKWFKKAADQGHADAQCTLGAMYYNGNGVPQNSAEAMKWFKKAADQGHADAQVNLRLM